MARYTAVLLVLVFSAASARMLFCESSCLEGTPTSVSAACHEHATGEGLLTQLTDAHSCDYGDVVFTLASGKVSFERASSVIVPSYVSSTETAHLFERFTHFPPGQTHGSRTRAITPLRI